MFTEITKLKLLRLTLILGALYYLIGAFAHFFGLTIFPFYDGRLYVPYHDSVIALAAIVVALFIFAVARDPVKNIDTLKVVIVGAALASVFSVLIIWKVDFGTLGAPGKKIQTLFEGGLGFVFVILLLWLYPRKNV